MTFGQVGFQDDGGDAFLSRRIQKDRHPGILARGLARLRDKGALHQDLEQRLQTRLEARRLAGDSLAWLNPGLTVGKMLSAGGVQQCAAAAEFCRTFNLPGPAMFWEMMGGVYQAQLALLGGSDSETPKKTTLAR